MAKANKRAIGIVVAVVCICAFVAIIVTGCVLQKQNEWKHRYELLSAEGNSYVVAEVTKVKTEYNHKLIKTISSKLLESGEDFYKSVVLYEVTIYLYNNDENVGEEQKLYYSYTHSLPQNKVAVIEGDEFKNAVAVATFEYSINALA